MVLLAGSIWVVAAAGGRHIQALHLATVAAAEGVCCSLWPPYVSGLRR